MFFSFWRSDKKSRDKADGLPIAPPNFTQEQLEPRLLLSAVCDVDDELFRPALESYQIQISAIVVDQVPGEATDEEVQLPESSDIAPELTIQLHEDIFDAPVVIQDAQTENKLYTGEAEALLSDPDIPDETSRIDFDYGDSFTEQLTETLLAANPPPAQQVSNFDFIFEAEPGNNDLTLRLSPQDQTVLELVDNVSTYALASCVVTDVNKIIIYGVDDLDDTLTVDFNYGLIEVPITFHGGDAGFDSMVIEGGIFANSIYTATSSDSGTILLDDIAIAYTGLEPITDNVDVMNRVFTATTGSDQIRLKNATASGYMTIESSNGTFESVTFINPSTSLTINAGDGDDTVIIESLDDLYAAEIIINGGNGDDTLVGPNATNLWELTGINAGSLTMSLANLNSGSAAASFSEIENLTGGSGKDSFAFGNSGGVTGSIDNGGGTVELIIGGFVIISGDYSFVKGSKSFTLSNDDIITAEYMTIGSSGGTVFVGTGGGGTNPVGFSATLGSFALAIITEQGGSGRVWRAISGTISEASFSGIDNLTIKAANFMLNFNTAASDGTVVDFKVDPLTFGAGLVIDFDGSTGELFTLKGSVTLNVFGFVLAIGDFEMTKATMPVVDGGVGNVYLANASVLSMSLGIANPASIFAGTGGAFNDPNNPTAFDTTNAVGFTAAASFSLAIIQDMQTPENKYVGLEFELVNASMDGITDMTFIVSASLLVNWTSVGDRLNWSVATSAANDTFNLLPAFTMTSAVELQIAGTMEIDIYGFVLAYGSFKLYKGVMTINDGSITTFNADLLSISFENVSLFAGTSGQFTYDTVSGLPNGFDDTVGAVGFYVASANLSLAILQNISTPANKYVGLEFGLGGIGLEGINNLTLAISNSKLLVNWASVGDRLNWTAATANDATHDQYSQLADFADLRSEVELQIAGTLEIDIYGFVLAYGGFKLYKGVMTINDGSLTTFNADLLSISFENVSLFAGTGGQFTYDTVSGLPNGFDDTVGAVGFYVASANLSLAILQNISTPSSKYVGLEFSLGGVGLEGIDDFTLIASGGVKVNWASEGDRLNWAAATENTATHDQHSQLADFTMAAAIELQVDGTMTLDAFGFVLASGGFKFTKGEMTVKDGAIEMVGASLLSIELQQVRVFAGVGASFNEDKTINTDDAVGFDAGTLTVTLAIVQDAITPSNIYMGLEFELLEAQLVGVNDLTLIVSGGVKVNWASEGNRLNWITATNGTNDPINLIPAFTLTSAIEFQIDGFMTLGAFGFFYASGGFSLLKSSATLTVTDGLASETSVEVDLLTIGSVINYAFAGENGPYWVDGDDNGFIDDGETNDEAIGLELSNVEIGVALMTTSLEGDQRYWAAIQAEVGTAGLVGFEGLDLQLSNIGIAINLGGGTTLSGDDNETVVDFLSSWDNNSNNISDPDIDGLEVNTGDDSPLRFDFTDRLIQAFGEMYLVIGDFVYVNGTVAFQKGGTLTASLNDGTDTTDATEVEVSYMTVGASSLDIFVGVGPYFQDLDDDGIIDEEPADGAIGFVVGNASFGLALLRSDTNSYYGISASLEQVGIVGLDAIEAIIDFDISNIAVKINGGNDGIRVVDFTKGNLDEDDTTVGFTRVKTGAGANDYIDFNFSEELIEASATVTLKIDDFVYIHGSLAFKYSPEKTVNLSNGNQVTVSVLAIAATDVNAFMGIGPYDFTPDADNADAVGLVVNNLSFGFAIMQNKTMPSNKYFALKGSADNVSLFGVPELTIGVDDIFLEVNYSNHISPLDGKRLVVDFTDDNLTIETSPSSSVVMNFADELIRARLSNGVFKLADFVHLSGNFAFEKGTPAVVDIATNIPGDFAKLGDLIPAQLKDFLDGFGDITDITRIEDVEVTTLYLGASEVNGFVGLNGPYYVTDENGQQIENNEAVGLSVENLNFGFVIMEPTLGALGSLTGLEGMLPKFYSLKASSDRVALVGVPEIVLEANAVSVSVNFGNTWVKGVESFGRPVVDFASSFPAETTDSDGDGKIDPAGFELNTGSSPIYMDHDGELLIGASVGKAIMHLSEFVHLSGTMAFELGPTYMVTVDAGIPAEIRNLINQALEAAGINDIAILQELFDLLGLDLEAGTIEHEVISFTMGGSDINAFVGMDGPYWTDLDSDDIDGGGKFSWVAVDQSSGEDVYITLTDGDDDDEFVDVVTIGGKEYGDINTDGIVDANETAELNENAVGLVAADLDFGMAVMQSNNPIFDLIREVIGKIAALIPGAGTLVSVLATVLGEYIRPRYYAMKGTAGQIGFVGLDEIIAEARNIVIEMNVATPSWGPFRPSLNFLKSFPDPDGEGPEQAGLRVDTGGEPVYLDFETKLVRASVEKATLQLSEFLYLGGSFAFEAGPSHSVTVNTGIPPDLLELVKDELSGPSGSDIQEVLGLLGFDLETGTITHGVDSFSIGGSDVTLFAGVGGPYWTDLDPDDINGGGKVSWVAPDPSGGVDEYITLTADGDGDGFVDVVNIGGKDYGDINTNGIIDANETAELNEDAIGLVATDLDFGISVMQSNSPVFSLLAGISPMAFLAELVRPRYFAVKGSAYNIGFIGMEEITAEIVNLSVQLNVATPWGPLLPSLDFVKSFPGEDLNDDNILDSEDTNGNGVLDTEDLNINGILDYGEDVNKNGILDEGEDLDDDGILDTEDLNGNDILDYEDVDEDGILDTEDKDGDGKLDPAGFELFTGSDSFYMDFENGLVRVSVGQATLRIFNLVALSGGFAFCAEGQKEVTLTNGDKKDVAIMTIAAENVYGFVGVNGPYRWDTNGDGIINSSDPVNTEAVGFAIDNFNVAMAIAVGLEILDPSVYFAMKSSADLIGFVGIAGLETVSDGMNIDVNVGLSLNSSAAIDFSKFDRGGLSIGFGESQLSSEVDETNPDEKGAIAKIEFPSASQVTILLDEGILQEVESNQDLVRFDESITDEGQLRELLEALDDDNIDVSSILAIWRENYNPRFLDFAKSLLKGHLAAKISFLGVEFEGSFGFDEGENDSTILTVLAYFNISVDDLTLYESLASGVLKIGDGGIAGKILLKSEASDPLAALGIDGLSFITQETRFDLLINTTEKEADILLPDYFNVLTAFDLDDIDYSEGVVLLDMLTTLKSTGSPDDLDFHLFIPKNQEVPPQTVPDANPELLGESYILIHADGKLEFPGILLEGTFDFRASGTEAMLIMDADFKIGAAGLSLLELKAAGVIKINSAGVDGVAGVAGKIKLSRTGDNLLEGLNIPGLNFGLDAQFDMLINTTLVDVDILMPDELNVFDAFDLSDTDPESYLGVGVRLPDKITILRSQPRGPPENGEYDYYLTIPKNAVLPGQPQPDSNQGGQFYILVHAEGTLELPGAKLDGSFNLFANESTVLIVMGGHLLVGFDGLELLNLVAGGAFQIDSTGFAGKLQLSLDEDLDSIPFGDLFEGIGESLGFDVGVQFDLVANTTTYDKDILLPDTFDALTAFAISDTDRVRLEGVVEGDDPEWVLLSDDLTRLQSQYDSVEKKVEYHLIVPKDSVPIDDPEVDPEAKGEFYILVHAVGKLLFPGFVLDGGFDLFVYQQNAVMDIYAVMTMGSLLQLNAIGILQVDDTGVAGKISLEIIDDNSPLSSLPGLGTGFGFDAEFNLIVNTTEQYKEIVFPERFNNLASFGLTTDEMNELNLNGSVVLKDGLTRLKSVLNDDNEIEYHLIVNNTPDKDIPPPEVIPEDNSSGEFYLLVYANGDLCLPGATLTGSFYLLAEDAQTVMTVSGHLIIGFGSINVLNLTAGGAFYIDDDGLAGKLQLELDQSMPFEDLFGPGFGFSQEAFFDLTINLTRQVQDFTLPESFNAIDVFGIDPGAIQNAGDEVILSDNLTILRLVYNTTSQENEYHLIVPDTPNPGNAAEAYILLHAVGELMIPGFTLYGGFDLYVDQQRATMDIHALMTLGFGDMTVLQLEAIGVAQIDLTGLAGKIHLQIIDNDTPPTIPGIETLGPITAPLSQLPGLGDDLGFGIDAKFDLIINTTKQYKDILLPDRFDNLKSFGITDQQETDLMNNVDSTTPVSVLLPDGLTRLKSVYIESSGKIEYHLIINNTPEKEIPPPVEIPTPNDSGLRYLVVHAEGELAFPGFKLDGTFDLEINEYFAVMAVNAQMVLGIPLLGTIPLETLTLLDLSAAGVLKMDSEGIAGKVKLSIDQGDTDSPDSVPFSDFLSQLGLDITIEANLDLLINTTWNKSEIELPDGFDPLSGFGLTGDVLDGFTEFKSALILDSVLQAKLADDLTSLRAVVKESHDGTLYVAYTLIVPNTPDGQNDIYGQRFILVRANGLMSFPGFELEGMFDLEMNDQFIIMAVNAKAFVGIGELKILELVAGGLLKLDSDGLAGKLKLRLASDIDPASIYYNANAPAPFSGLAAGLTMNAEFDLILNTTEKKVNIVLPDAFDPFISFNISDDIKNVFLEDLDGVVPPVPLDDKLTTLESDVDTSRPSGLALTLTIPNTPTGQDDDDGEYYIIAHADGELIYSGFKLIGVFDLLIMEDKCEMRAAASLTLGPLGSIEATGLLIIDELGLVGQIVLEYGIGQDAIGGIDIGIEIDGTFLLEINTGNNRQVEAFEFGTNGLELKTIWIETGILVRADVTIDFLGMLQANADLIIEYRVDKFYLKGNAHIAIGSLLDTNMYIELEVTDEGVTMGATVNVKASILEIITIDATGELLLNTRDYTVNILGKNCVANSFLLDLDGKVVILGVLQFDAAFKVQVGGGTFAHNAIASPKATLPTGGDAYLYAGKWAVSFGASMDFFGFEDVLTADGWFNYLGNFEVHLSGNLLIGSKTCGIEGNFDIDVSSHNSVFNLSGDASASVYLVGYKVAGVDVEFDFDSDTGEVTITGTLTVKINLLVKTITITASRTFTIGVLEIPKPVYLAGSTSDNTLPGGKVDSDGNLYLNIGSRATYRELAESVVNETFYIRHISGDYANGETIEVTCFGRTQEFSGVKHIIANGGTGNDMIVLKEGMTSSVDLNGGSGNDVIIHRGSGGGTPNSIHGGSGDDHLELGDDIAVSVNLYGDGGNDYIQGGPGDDYIDGGSGNDRILGGDGVDTIYGRDGSDVIVGGLGEDKLYGEAGEDTFEWASGDGEDSVIDGDSGLDLLVITAGDNDEDIVVSNSGTDIIITLDDGVLALTLTGLNLEAIEINLVGGADSLTLEDIQDSNVTQVNLNLGNNDDAADRVLLKGSAGNDSFVLDAAGGLLNISRVGVFDMIIVGADRSFGDKLAIETYAGSDTINAAAVIEDLLALTLTAGQGNDIIIGSPFNDELNSGSGSDTVTGNAGEDIFLDDSGPDDIDTLVEILNCDMSLFDNLFVAGTIMADDGSNPFFKSSIIDEQNTPIDPDFPAPVALQLQDNGDVYASGAEVESLLNGNNMPIFERAYLFGGDSNNVIVVGDLDGEITVGGDSLSVTNWTGEVTLDNGANRGDGYNEYYILNLNGTSGSVINILDTGGYDGFDEVYIIGTLGNDSVLLNAVRDGAEMTGIVIVGEPELTDSDNIQKMTVVGGVQVPLFYQHDSEGNKVQRTDADDNLIYDLSTGSPVAIYLETTDNTGDPVMVNSLNPDRDDVSFAAVERVTIKTLAGDDTVISKDTAAPTVVYLGDGDDMMIIGVVPQINDPDNVMPGYPVGIPVADVENMSNGNSAVMTVYGENGGDEFEVNHNTSKLYLHGGADNDRFIINTFLVLRENADSDDISNLSTLFGGSGSDRYEYLQNAPVNIEGGTGDDILVISGTPINDTFIITNNFVAGAGIIVPFSGIETVEVNAGGGADKIYVMSSDPNLTINVNGGSGDDTIHLGGDPEVLFFDPPATTYTPPSYQVQDPPVTAYETMALNFGQTTLALDWNWMFYGFNTADARDAVSNYVNNLVNLMSLFRPGLELTSSVDDIVAQSVINYSYGFRWWIFDPEVYVTFDLAAFELQYPTQALPPLRTVVPAPVTIDPPPFALKVDSSFNLSEIQGKVVINGGDTFETNGDKVIVHNQDGEEIPGTLTDVKLTGLGLGEEGIEYNNLEEMTILFGNGSDTLTINDTHTGPLTVSMGPGDDTVFVEGISGETTILAGAGNDTINVADGSKMLNAIGKNLTIKGDEGLTEQVDYLPYIDDYDAIETQIYINSEPDLEYTDSAGNVIGYAQETRSRIIFEQSGNVWMWVAVLDPVTGEIFQDLVQERNADGDLLWLNSDGNKTTNNNNYAPSLIEVGRNKAVPMTQTEIIAAASGPGSDTLNVDDSLNDNDTAGVLTGNTLDISSMPGQIIYSGVDLLNIDLGSGFDVFNVQSTIAVTNLSLHDGLDRVYVSSAADVGLTNTIDFLPGHLDDINGTLNIDAGSGKNLLMISDEGATIADSNILITDQLTADISITGIAPAAITYKAATSGSFAGGVTVWTGFGSDIITIDGTHYRNAQYTENSEIRTITTLNTGAGDDNVIVSLDASEDGFFVLNTQVGNDIVDASASTLPLIILGGDGQLDIIKGGLADDVILGDYGTVSYYDDSGQPVTVLGNGGLGDKTDGIAHINREVQADSNVGGNDLIYGQGGDDLIFGQGGDDLIFGDYGQVNNDGTLIETIQPNQGGADTIASGSGNDIIIGGTAGDTINAGSGNDLVFGDHGQITGNIDVSLLPLETAAADNPAFVFISIYTLGTDGGGDDIIFGSAGKDIILGQQGSDTIYGGDSDDDIIGGHNVTGGFDAGDNLDGGTGDDVIAGDNAVITRLNASAKSPRMRVLEGTVIYGEAIGLDDGEPLIAEGQQLDPTGAMQRIIQLLDHTDTTSQNFFGSDYVAGGADDDMIFGQLGDDIIQGDGSIDITAVGAYRDTAGVLIVSASVEEAASDGDDYIEGNGGNDVIFGNLGQDDIIGGSSELFSLDTAAKRIDGEDMIFGGAGTDLARNNLGDNTLDNGHALDADVIVGDNGNIYRLVGINEEYGGDYLTFNYDNYGTEKIIVRVAELIDYTPGGPDFDPTNAANDIGASDEIHGESGDDVIYGQTGDDVIFGEGQDDDLIGGWGCDFISGGAGIDGILGDDGRIYTSRNTSEDIDELSEPLYNIYNIQTDRNSDRMVISTPGKFQEAEINIIGQLLKTVNLSPFNLDPNVAMQDSLFDAENSDDILYGGIGDDFIHGGAGDDAISGAEALPETAAIVYPEDMPTDALRTDGVVVFFGYDNPLALSKLESELGYGVRLLGFETLRAEEFAAYSEYEPLSLISIIDGKDVSNAFFLNFNSDEGQKEETPGIFSDGDDRLFGDLGNDWIVGGTGRDHLYGGRGNDLLNVDDDLSSNDGLNNIVDGPEYSYDDIAYGGAGRDVLIANTGGDRLIDWVGEFNSYIAPSKNMPGTISRVLQPKLMEYLYNLSKSDGADQTRSIDTGNNPLRNGEPDGELGLVLQKDDDWHDQTGAPDDPQLGNIPGGARDILTGADFNLGNLDNFGSDSGTWEISSGRLEVSPEVLGGDAVSVLLVDQWIPSYFEVKATINAGKPTAGFKSNAYLIFDYQGPTDFKFAGINVSSDKLEMGHRDTDGWHVDEQTNARLKPNQDYQLLLAINGTVVTLIVNNEDVLTHVFAPRFDADGFSYAFNAGMVGVGAFNSAARIDNVVVQVLPPETTLEITEDFERTSSELFTGSMSGLWQVIDSDFVATHVIGLQDMDPIKYEGVRGQMRVTISFFLFLPRLISFLATRTILTEDVLC